MQRYLRFHKSSRFFSDIVLRFGLQGRQTHFYMPLKVTWKKYRDLSDTELLEKFRDSGNLEVLGILYERYMHLVYGVCLKYLHNRDEAKDGITALFEKLMVEIPRNEIRSFKPWLYVLTKNYCLMKLRSDRTERSRLESFQNDPTGYMESETEMHPMDKEDDSLNEALEDCMKRLKAEQRSAVILFYYEKRSYREIATKLKLEEKKVKSLIQNGKRNLKICLEEKDVREG